LFGEPVQFRVASDIQFGQHINQLDQIRDNGVTEWVLDAIIGHLVSRQTVGHVFDRLVKPVPKLSRADSERCLNIQGNLALDTSFLFVAQGYAKVAGIGATA